MNPPLTPGAGSAPLLTVRVTPEQIDAVVEETSRSGKSRGEIVREALEAYLGIQVGSPTEYPQEAGAA